MPWPNFSIEVPGKWILTGEHSVIRGFPAIALPHDDLSLKFDFNPGGRALEIFPKNISKSILELLEIARSPKPEGTLTIESTIPMGSGFGSSAALCVALTKWLATPLSISEDKHFEFAKVLENHFHGESSGMDIAVVMKREALLYVKGQGGQPLGLKKLPRFTFHDTGKRAKTLDCVRRVKALITENPALLKYDTLMGEATERAQEGLRAFDQGNKENGLKLLAEGMKKAQECFYAWNLVPKEALALEKNLYQQGALAVKITGAGGGGFLVALWGEKIYGW